MPNIPKIYRDLITVKDGEDKPKQVIEEDAGHFQSRVNWKNNLITIEFKDSLEKNINACLIEAVQAAVSYSSHGCVTRVLTPLLRVDTMIKIQQQLFSNEPYKNSNVESE